MPKKCKATNSTPHTNMKSGHFYWKDEPCTEACVKGSNYCLMHQDHQQRENAMRAALAPAMAAALAQAKP